MAPGAAPRGRSRRGGGGLRRARDVRRRRTTGSPTGRAPQGDGVPRVVVGVASHQGDRASRAQGDGAQVIQQASAGRPA
jgi:hypothetical protein